MRSNTNSNISNKETIPKRINSIKEMLEGKEIEPLIDFDNTDTEYFLNDNKSYDSNGSYDTRIVLKKKMYDFVEIIKKFGGKLEYIKSGTTGHTFKGETEDFDFAIKVVAYPRKSKYGTIYETRRPENVELVMLKLLSYFVINKQTPHIILPICAFDTDIKVFTNLIEKNNVEENNKSYKRFEKNYSEGKYHNTVSILISEWANRGDLSEFIKKRYMNFTPMHWKVIFFQIFSVLAVIQSKFPSFRHNDFKANNILVQKTYKLNKKVKYTIESNLYVIPNMGYQIKIWDFDFSCIPGVVDNIKASDDWTQDINVTPIQNRYYDIHYFLNTFIKNGFFPQFFTDEHVPQDAKDFVDRVLPYKLRGPNKKVLEKGRILDNKEYFIPNDVLMKDPYFEEFRVEGLKHSHTSAKHSYKSISESDRHIDINQLLNKY
jgi:hypothetical protein